MTILEMTVALVILASAAVALTQLVGLINRQRHMREQRLAALAEIANQAERLSLLSWDAAAPGKLTTWEPSPELVAAIPKANCRVLITEELGPPVSRKIELRVAWKNAAELEVEPATLKLWKFRAGGQP